MLARLAHRVDPETGCWEWLKARMAKGYGETWDGQRVVYAHRVYYEQAHGPIPKGMQIDHLCRNRGCVNPEHLEPVTNAENTRRGNATPLTWDDVREIRAATGVMQKELAERYGVRPCTISKIIRELSWKED